MITDNDRQFEFLLNAFERASQSDNPAAYDYGAKRVAVFELWDKKTARIAELEAEIVRLKAEVELVKDEWVASQ